MRRFIALMALISASLSSAGCSGSTQTLQIHSGSTAGISYELRGSGHPSESRSANGDIEASLGPNRLEIKGGRVLANGKDYGPVKQGDKVMVDATGQVFLNGRILH
jgi:hypothetical protein